MERGSLYVINDRLSRFLPKAGVLTTRSPGKITIVQRSLGVCCWLFILLPLHTIAEVNEQRAKFNYQMFCQGCHTEDGTGHKSVPNLKGFMGHFLSSQEGREYLVRVPGSANAVLNNGQLAEVLNWMLVHFSEDSLPKAWQQFDGGEVTEYRKDPLFEVVEYRKKLLRALALNKQAKKK